VNTLTQDDRGTDVDLEVGEHRCRDQSAAQPNRSTYAMIEAARPRTLNTSGVRSKLARRPVPPWHCADSMSYCSAETSRITLST
jgi:hypothetical protein